jgi:hypothetical protein
MNGDSRDMPGHRPVVALTTTDTRRVARDRVTDLLAWRCCRGRCVDRPLHDRMDWWPAWALEARWSA